MKRVYIYIIAIFLIGTKISAQEFNGVLLDSLDQEPIVYAHISSAKTGIGTISNEKGEFAFSSFSTSDTLTITHMGYKTIKIPFSSNRTTTLNTFHLIPDMVELNEVIVSNDLVSGIVSKVISQLEKSPITFGKGFYRQTAFRGEKPTEWIEAFYNMAYSKNGIDKIKIDQARFARAKYDTESPFLTFTNFSYFSVSYQLFAPKSNSKVPSLGKPFGKDFEGGYDFYLNKQYSKQGENFYVINFEPNSTINNAINSYGTFIYNTSKELLVKYSFNVEHSLGVDDLSSYKGDKNIEIINPKYSFEINFSEDLGVLSFMTSDFNYDFIQDGIVFPSKVRSSFVFYQTLEEEPKNLRKSSLELENVSNFEKAKYRPRFWKDNPVIKLTKEEEEIINSFEKENAFGTYFK